jgi:hypothetical protein
LSNLQKNTESEPEISRLYNFSVKSRTLNNSPIAQKAPTTKNVDRSP